MAWFPKKSVPMKYWVMALAPKNMMAKNVEYIINFVLSLSSQNEIAHAKITYLINGTPLAREVKGSFAQTLRKQMYAQNTKAILTQSVVNHLKFLVTVLSIRNNIPIAHIVISITAFPKNSDVGKKQSNARAIFFRFSVFRFI